MDQERCGLSADELVPLACTLLEVPADLVETALGLELEEGAVVADEVDGMRCIFLAELYHAEREIASASGRWQLGRRGRPVSRDCEWRKLTASGPPWRGTGLSASSVRKEPLAPQLPNAHA